MLAIASQQLVLHREQLAVYAAAQQATTAGNGTPGSRSLEQWRGVTLRLGVLYELAAVDFWAGIASDAGGVGAEHASG